MIVIHNFAILADHRRVLNDAVVAGRNHDHLLWAEDDLLIVLTNERLWTDLKLCHIAVLVKDVDVIVRWDTIDALRFTRVCLL